MGAKFLAPVRTTDGPAKTPYSIFKERVSEIVRHVKLWFDFRVLGEFAKRILHELTILHRLQRRLAKKIRPPAGKFPAKRRIFAPAEDYTTIIPCVKG